MYLLFFHPHHYFLSVCLFFLSFNFSFAQSHVNGTLDDLQDLTSIITVPLTMPDGVDLMTDIYVPITSDSLVLGFDLLGTYVELELIPKGTQLVFYPDRNGQANPNPYQLPMIFSRTPYNKAGTQEAQIVSLLGYSFAMQDMRGRYASEGVYFPMLSDSWAKAPYHPDYSHAIDMTPLSDPLNSNNHEDGWDSVDPLLQLSQWYDLDNNGTKETFAPICDGSIGMFGASALGNTQYQLVSAHKIDPTQPGIKCLAPIVATNEHYNCTGYNNGVFRESLVAGWVRGQLYDLDDSAVATDLNMQDNIHSAADYSQANKYDVAEECIDHFSINRYNGNKAAAYPNSTLRLEMDASFVPVDALGEADPNGTISRYQNMDVPAYHLSGWWDIFVNGQIDTYNKMLANLPQGGNSHQLQKLVIGPYAHQTISSTQTGDVTYKNNASEIIGLDISNVDLDNLNIDQVLQSEAIAWYRYNLNYEQGLGEPMIKIPESNNWQPAGILGSVRVPSEDYIISLADLLNFVGGAAGLPEIEIEIDPIIGGNFTLDIPLPNLELGGQLGFNLDAPISGFPYTDFKTVPNVRFYVVGPNGDGIAANDQVGNYWFASDHFPLTTADGINWHDLYFHSDGSLNFNFPSFDEGFQSFVHDPDNPVRSVGGANMLVKTPNDNRDSQGQIDLSNPLYINSTLVNPGVISFETNPIVDSLTIMGYPKATIYASSNPQSGPPETDTDFFVRILDVYPDGRELFVVEGAVNARARDYARSIFNGNEDENTPFSNINSGEIYEYQFELLPIAYTWGKDHKMKVLISSSNYNRYQVNPNLPLEDGDFFRRTPGDGQTYNFQGADLDARIADQQIFISPSKASKISLPIYNQNLNPPVLVKAEAFLEGPYMAASQSMRNELRTSAYISSTPPFTAAPWNYSGPENIAVSAMPVETVDWVLLQALDPITNNLIEEQAALLLTDGSIVDPDGTLNGVNFYQLIAGDSYLFALRSRNHLDVVAAQNLQVPNGLVFNFSQPLNVLNGNEQLANLDGVNFGLKAGDISKEGIISIKDFNEYFNNLGQGNQYLNADINMDKFISITDFNLYLGNSSSIGESLIRY